jgi:hypothetical protein
MTATLITDTVYPPGGFRYREVAVNWEAPRELALLGLDAVAEALQRVRVQNPQAGLNPDYDACVEDIKQYTCARLQYDPKWCALPAGEQQKLTAGQAARRCGGCGR